jgi:hypothetical protein
MAFSIWTETFGSYKRTYLVPARIVAKKKELIGDQVTENDFK